MPRPAHHDVIPGGLTDADRERICDLAERGWKAPRIAKAISKHTSTVYWYMCREGLVSVRQVEVATTVQRGSSTVRGFNIAEDDFMVERRNAGLKPKAIAAALSAAFGRPCRPHSVGCRLIMLACLDRYDPSCTAAEAAKPQNEETGP